MAAAMNEHRPTLRVIKILETLANAQSSGLTLSEIAHAIEQPANSLLPYVKTLCSNEYVSMDPRTMCYRLGPKCLSLSAGFQDTSDVYATVHHEMEKAAKEAEEICQVGILDGADVFYVAKVDAPQALRLVSSVGKRVPATCTALGKCFLCEFSKEQIEALYPQGLPALTDYSITNLDELMRQLKKVRDGDFAQDMDESLLHLRCFALPIRVNDRIDSAISISTPDFRLTRAKEDLVKRLLLQARDRIERQFSFLGRGLSSPG